jgi:hypothetical protein
MTGGPGNHGGPEHGVRLYDAEDPPRELLEPRLPAAPMKRLCVTPELDLLEWLESLGAAVPRGEHQA